MSEAVVRRARVGRPPLTDRAQLLAAAREIGFVGLTVGAVTARVGVKYSTFYRHFPSLHALSAALVDDVLGTDLVLPQRYVGQTWQAYLVEVCQAALEVGDRWPGLATTIDDLDALPERVQACYRRLTGALLSAGFTPDDAALGAIAALETVGQADRPVPAGNRGSCRGAELARRQQQILDTAVPIADPVRAATGTTAPADARSTRPQQWSTRKISLLIEGLEARLTRHHQGRRAIEAPWATQPGSTVVILTG